MSIDEIEAVALELPEAERAELIDRLWDSMSDEINPAAVEESHRIMREIEAGRMKSVPAEEVLAMLDEMAR